MLVQHPFFSLFKQDLSACPFLDVPGWLLVNVSDVECNRYSTDAPVALWQRWEGFRHLWILVPAGSCVTFTAHSTKEWTTRAASLGSLPASKSYRYFRLTAAARLVLSGSSRSRQCHVRLKLFRCSCCSQSKLKKKKKNLFGSFLSIMT